MKSKMIATTTAFLFAVGLTAFAEEKSKKAEDADQSAVADVLNTLHMTNWKAVKLAEMALAKSENKEVDGYAIVLMREHQIADQKVQRIARDAKIALVEPMEVDISTEEDAAAKKAPKDEKKAQAGERPTKDLAREAAAQFTDEEEEETAAQPQTKAEAATPGEGEEKVDEKDPEKDPEKVQEKDLEKDQAAKTHAKELKATVAQLQPLSGDEFDREYLTMMAEGHSKFIDQLKQSKQGLQNEQVTQLIDEMMPKLQHHQEQAAQLLKQFDGGSEGQAKSQKKQQS